MGEIIRFTDARFLALYKSPAEPDTNRRARLIYKALEIHHQVKEKENANKQNNKKEK